MRFFGLFKCVDKKEGGAVSTMVSTESMLGGVEHVLGFPCGADPVRMRYVSMLVHSLRKISSGQMGRRSSMLLSSAVLGSGISHRCFQNYGMC